MLLRLVSPQEDVSWGCPSGLPCTLVWEVRFWVGFPFALHSPVVLFFCVCPASSLGPLFLLLRSRDLPVPGSDGAGRDRLPRGCCLQHHRPSRGGAADLPWGLPPKLLRGPEHLEPVCSPGMEPGGQWYASRSSRPTLLGTWPGTCFWQVSTLPLSRSAQGPGQAKRSFWGNLCRCPASTGQKPCPHPLLPVN